MTSPAWISRRVTAAIASSSRSKTRAGPRCESRSWPAIFTTQPSGARLPLRMTRPPLFLSGRSSGATTSWPGVDEPLRHDAGSPGVAEVDRGESPTRLQPGPERRAPAHAIEIVDRERDVDLAREREQVEDGVRRAAARRHAGDRVLEGGARRDLARAETASQHVHDEAAGAPADLV